MGLAIKFENISKQYRLGEVGTGTLSNDLHRVWARLCGKPDPFAKVGAVNSREEVRSEKLEARRGLISRLSPLASSFSAASADYVWALKDIDFDVQQGEILGIIGRNGAGKSTLLKLLSRVSAPTTGFIKSKGRIASLLEVGTGFHPELTGRENIYLNGAILGMSSREITKQLEAIVEFSGCAKYIDTPVKRYSSGMTVRLGFAVAAHLDCEILVVDEVLAVGDAEFQKKCIGKMQSISLTSGKTVLFVSHNMASVERLCRRGILMERGTIAFSGDISDAVSNYLAKNEGEQSISSLQSEDDRSGSGEARLRMLTLANERSNPVSAMRCGDRIKITFEVENLTSDIIERVSVGYSLSTPRGESLVVAYSDYEGKLFRLRPGTNCLEVTTGCLPFRAGVYQIGCRLLSDMKELDWPKYPVATILIEGGDIAGNSSIPHSGRGLIMIENEWCEVEKAISPGVRK